MSQTLTLDTGHAQRVMARGFRLTVASIGRLSTILYVLADEAQVDKLNQNISTWLDDFVTDVRATTQQLQQKLDDEGINGEPSYTNPQKVTISFGSPAVYKLITALSEFDRLGKTLDALWFAGLVDHRQHNDIPYEIRKRFLRLNREITAMEHNAANSAGELGKSAEVAEALAALADPKTDAETTLDTVEEIAA